MTDRVKIYTKTGDSGNTSLFGGKKVPKSALRLEAYGTVDELNSLLGVCRSLITAGDIDTFLKRIQSDLFRLGAELASAETAPPGMFRPVTDEDIRALETEIDRIDPLLAPLKQFILPGGTQGAAMLHVARSVCRRAERLVVSLSESEKVRGMIVVYLNRLSDLLFVLARWTNARENRDEERWTP